MEFYSKSGDSEEGIELDIEHTSTNNTNTNGSSCSDENHPSFLEAKTVYLLLPKNVPVSRASRLQWLLDHLNSIITINNSQKLNFTSDEIEIASILPRESNLPKCQRFLVTCRTEVMFIAHSYRLVYCLDMSPSQAIIDSERNEVLFDAILNNFTCSLEGLLKQFIIPATTVLFQPNIYLTVIVNTPFFISPAQQVLVKGIQISSSNLQEVLTFIKNLFYIFEGKIADVSSIAQDQIELQKKLVESEENAESIYEVEIPEKDRHLPKTSMVSPDANFVNMLRYSMLAISLLPENSLSHILVITDGVVAMPDSNIMESLLYQLHYDGIAVSFLKVSSFFYPNISAGYVSYNDLLNFFAHSTMGISIDNCVTINEEDPNMNIYHELFLLWSFHTNNKQSLIISGDHKLSNTNYYNCKTPVLLLKKQSEDNVSSSILFLLSRRLREGFTVDVISNFNGRVDIRLCLQWKSDIYIHYKLSSQWPLLKTATHFEVYITAPYEFLHDITCILKKDQKSVFRQAIIDRFWMRLSQLSSGEQQLAQQLSSFPQSSMWYTPPESIKNRIPVFVINGTNALDNAKICLTASDQSFQKFGNMWLPLCQLETTNWRKWLHVHKISFILKHDYPLPKHLHSTNSSQRYQVVQCRQAAAILHEMLANWCSVILVDNHTYAKLLHKDQDKPPTWFCIFRISSKLPCAVLNIGFSTNTPGFIRHKVCEELKHNLSSLKYKPGPFASKEKFCCVLLQKPLEKILIRYDRVPTDFTTVIFPDGTQPPDGSSSNIQCPLSGSLFTTLSRYLYHKRWIWSAMLPPNPQLTNTAVSRILSSLTSMRLKEGFRFVHSSSGIITMALELWMDTGSCCMVQYVIFPAHRSLHDEFTGGSEEDHDLDFDFESELQLITEVWIEPQYGRVVPSRNRISYMDHKLYYELADTISQVDKDCINTLLTMEHLSLMCQEKIYLNSSMYCSTVPSSTKGPARRMSKQISSDPSAANDKRPQWYPLVTPRIEHIPFTFNPIGLLHLCQNIELLFSMFLEGIDSDYQLNIKEKPNLLLLQRIQEHFLLLHDQELELSQKDCYSFTKEILNRHKNNHPSFCPVGDIPADLENPHDERTSCQWRCFLKAISVTHIILTFIPTTLSDIELLVKSNKSTVPESLESEGEVSDENSNCSDVPIKVSNSLTLPIYVFDCPLSVLVNAYVNNYKVNVNKDICEDHRFKYSDYTQEDCIKLKDVGMDDNRNEDPEKKHTIKNHCKGLIMTHSKCFTTSIFTSLHRRLYVHPTDVQSCMDQCEEHITEIDITDYLMAVCGHIKFSESDKIELQLLNTPHPCRDLKSLHGLIKEKFFLIVAEDFSPIPTNTEFYFCRDSAEKLKENISVPDSDDEFSNSPESNEFNMMSQGSLLFGQRNANDDIDLERRDTNPLFLHFIITIRVENVVSNISVQVIPTCLGELMQALVVYMPAIEKSKLKITLDIFCLSLPKNVQSVIEGYSSQGLRTTSFCSDGFLPSLNRSLSETSSDSDYNDLEPFLHFLEYQRRSIITLRDEIRWLLRDEICTALLDVYPVTTENLNFVINHVNDSKGRTSCYLDVIKLNFVYGFERSYEKFLNEFTGIHIPCFKICQEDDLYYLGKDQTFVDLNLTTSSDPNDKNSDASFGELSENYKSSCKRTLFVEDESFESEHDEEPESERKSELNTVIANEELEEAEAIKIDPKGEKCYIKLVTEVEYKQETETRPKLDNNDPKFCDVEPINEEMQSSYMSNFTTESISETDCGYEEDISEDYECYDWLITLGSRRIHLPNFWLIMKIAQESITIYFHCRFLELPTAHVGLYLEVQKLVKESIRDLCKRVNQSLLLQSLYETRVCSNLLELDDTSDWGCDSVSLSRNASFSRLRSMDDQTDDEYPSSVSLPEASLNFKPGDFSCPVVWETHFVLHPRIRNAKPGVLKGIISLKNTLEKFSVSNRSNMFVYRDNRGNVFYLRLFEMRSGNTSRMTLRPIDLSDQIVSRSPSIVSLPLGQNRGMTSSEQSICSTILSDIRPRVRSFGEKDTKENSDDDTLVLKVHGITEAGTDVQCDLVQVLQNRLDDAVLEILTVMLARNTMCPLTPEDVHFMQKPFRYPEMIIRLSVQEFAVKWQDSFIPYLRQNLLQFLSIPKYADTKSHYHLKDYTQTESVNTTASEENIFIYNQSQAVPSGRRGIACIAVALIANSKINTSVDLEDTFKNSYLNKNFRSIVQSEVIESGGSVSNSYLEFRIWQQGKVNILTLCDKLTAATSQALWDIIIEHYLLNQPLCEDIAQKERPKIKPVAIEDMDIDIASTEVEFNCVLDASKESVNRKFGPHHIKRIDPFLLPRKRNKNVIPPNSRTKRSITFENDEQESNGRGVPSSENFKPVKVNSFESGDDGVLCEAYSRYLQPWLEFGTTLSVPSVKKHKINLTNHLPNVIVKELLNFIQDSPKAFQAIPTYPLKMCSADVFETFYSSNLITKCIIISRNFEHWKLLTSNAGAQFLDIFSPQTLKHVQKFTPVLNNNRLIPRQKILWILVECESIIIYTYNWTKENISMLIKNCTNLGFWLSVRSYFLNSITSQKLGLFYNQSVTRKPFLSSNNQYASFIGELEGMMEFPRDLTRRTLLPSGNLSSIIEAFRETFHYSKYTSIDPVVNVTIEMQEMRVIERRLREEIKKLHTLYQARTSSITVPLIFLLMQNSRLVHFCHTPLLFLPRWRVQSAATRDHALNPIAGKPNEKPPQDEKDAWHSEICYNFFLEYRRYLQTLGFQPLQIDCQQRKSGLFRKDKSSFNSVFYIQKTILGGILLFTMEFNEPFFATKLYAVECNRLQTMHSKAVISRFTLSFLDECDKIRIWLHIHSFTYDYHLRSVYHYVSNNSTNNKIVDKYNVNRFLDDFMKYYTKAPNFARNLVHADTITIKNLPTEGRQLFEYLLSNVNQYNFKVLEMENLNGEPEYILVQITSTSQVSYKDEQDFQHTDDFNVSLVVYDLCYPYSPTDNILHLKYYLLLTSKKEIYPKTDIGRQMGKFRTVSSTRSTSEPELFSEEQVDVVDDETDEGTDSNEEELSVSSEHSEEISDNQTSIRRAGIRHIEISQESVNYLGYYSSHEELMQKLILDKAEMTRVRIKKMVAKGMVDCRTHLLWNKLISQDLMSYNEFIELRDLAKVKHLCDMNENLGALINQPLNWYQGLAKLLLNKYYEQTRTFISADGNTQHHVILHSRYFGAFMLLTVDLHTSRGDLYMVSRDVQDHDLCMAYRKELLDGFINCVCFYLWSGMI